MTAAAAVSIHITASCIRKVEQNALKVSFFQQSQCAINIKIICYADTFSTHIIISVYLRKV